jgi:Sushi repeat (SCR repeat)
MILKQIVLISEIVCAHPPQENGLIVQVSSYSVSAQARYTCPRGSNMEGNDTRICIKGGTWSGLSPACRREFPTTAIPPKQI